MSRKYERPKLFSVAACKSLGRYREFGCSMYGNTLYGAGPIYLDFNEDEKIEVSGVYQRRYNQGRKIYVRERFYFPKYPNTVAQLATRQAMRDAMLAWKNLTDEEKSVYNIRAKGKSYYGFNLYVKEFILSH